MIKITTTNAQIGIQSTPTKMSIRQPKADFDMQQKHPKILLETEPIQIRIDQSQCFAEAGLKSYSALTEEQAARAKQAALEGIGRIVSEGNTLAAIENKYDAIAEIAASNFIQVADWNIDFIPKSRPKIDFVGGNVDISVDEGTVELRAKQNNPIIDVEVGSVEISLIQRPSISFEYIGKEIDKSV